jgi:hypothetical protein
MAIRKEGKEVQDNMDYKSSKEKMQEGNRIEKVDVFNLRDYFKYKDAIQNDKDLKDVFPPNYPIKQLDLFRQTLEKEENKS